MTRPERDLAWHCVGLTEAFMFCFSFVMEITFVPHAVEIGILLVPSSKIFLRKGALKISKGVSMNA